MMQLDIPLSRATDPLSSHEAADRVDAEAQRETVWSFTNLHPGCTTYELAVYFKQRHGKPGVSVDKYERMFGRRLADLAKLGRAIVGPRKLTKYSKTAMQTWSAHG